MVEPGDRVTTAPLTQKRQNRVDGTKDCTTNHGQTKPHRRHEMLAVGLSDRGRMFIEYSRKLHKCILCRRFSSGLRGLLLLFTPFLPNISQRYLQYFPIYETNGQKGPANTSHPAERC